MVFPFHWASATDRDSKTSETNYLEVELWEFFFVYEYFLLLQLIEIVSSTILMILTMYFLNIYDGILLTLLFHSNSRDDKILSLHNWNVYWYTNISSHFFTLIWFSCSVQWREGVPGSQLKQSYYLIKKKNLNQKLQLRNQEEHNMPSKR